MAASSQALGIYIDASANFYVRNADEVSIWGTMENRGNLGSDAGAKVIFYGSAWLNTSTATYPIISGAGGVVSFVQPRPSPYGNYVAQALDGAYTTGTQPSFPNLEVDNANSVTQLNTNSRVTNDINFINGKIVLNANDMILGSASGNGGVGTISNYNENKYFVTNSTAGHLVKELYDGNFTFPVGLDQKIYSPALINNSASNAVHVNVTDYATSAPSEGVTLDGMDRTWNIFASTAGISATVDLQHYNVLNQVNFVPSAHFVTRYVGIAPNSVGDVTSQSKWESNTPGAGSATGTLTTGAPIAGASERSRSYASLATSPSANSAYYSKASNTISPLPISLKSFNGRCENGQVNLNWETGVETAIDGFVVEKSADASSWKNVGRSEAQGNNSTYNYRVDGGNNEMMVYRLAVQEKAGTISYSTAIRVGCNNAPIAGLQLFPNPNNGTFNVSISLPVKQVVQISVINSLGQTVKEMVVNASKGISIIKIDAGSVSAGSYFVSTVLNGQRSTLPFLVK